MIRTSIKRILIAFFIFNSCVFAQEKINFPSEDGLMISADFYKALKTRPCILMFHQANFSRGEYLQTAKAFQKLGYNCIAIDQRSGNAINGINNETAALAKAKKLPSGYLDAEKDMNAAIEYCFNRFQKKVIIMGSSYSASLVLKLASTNEHIAMILAFSPGEYFDKKITIANYIASIKIPTWVTSSKSESAEVTMLLENADKKWVKQFIPNQEGEHGSKVLWNSDATNNEYWKEMLSFMNPRKK